MRPTLELFASPPGTGKTTHCIELFRAQILQSKSGIDSRSFFVLPSREHAERIQNLILKKDVEGVFNAHILTINDLAARLLGVPALPRPTDAVRLKILKEILAGPFDFRYFADAKGLPGFHRLLVDSLREFKAGLITVSDFEKRAQSLLKSEAFRLKFRDFSVVLKNYEKKLAALGFAEPEDLMLDLRSEPLEAGSVDLVVFDGFYHFSRAQEELVRAASRASSHTVVTLTVSEKEGDRPDLFYYPERTRQFLKTIGFKEKKEDHRVNYRAKNPALVRLESCLFSKNLIPDAVKPTGIAIFEAPHVRGEIEMIAREIRRLAREEALYLSDICVILRSVSPYQKTLASVFVEFGIPAHIHERFKVSQTALGSFLYRLMNLFVEGWTREDLFYLAKSGLVASTVSLEDISAFERSAYGENVSEGRVAWLALARGPKLPQTVRTLLKIWADLEAELRSARTGRAFAAALRRFLFKLDVSEDESSRRSLEEILRSFERPASTPLEPTSALQEMRSRIETALFSARPSGKNRVQVYDAVMALPKEYKVVFVSGLVEKSFPQIVSEDPLFKDNERRVMSGASHVLEERALRASGERYFFYMALMRSREKVILTYPLYGADGRPTLSSFFIEEARKCFKEPIPTRTRPPAQFLPEPQEWEIEADVKKGVARLGPRAAGPLKDWLRRPDFKEVLLWTTKAKEDPHAALFDPRIREAFFKNKGPFSATRLEEMAACSFRYFASQVLELKEPLEGRESIEMGVALHKVLETYFQSFSEEARQKGEHLKDLARMKKALKELLLQVAQKSPLSRGKVYRYQTQLTAMKRSLDLFAEAEKELFQKRGLTATSFELKFGAEGHPFLEIGAGASAVRLRGQIDRLDITPDGKRALVVDYKLSKRPSVHAKFEKGLELQLPLYLLAAKKLLGYDIVGAEHRYLREPGKQGFYREDARELLRMDARETFYTVEEFEALLSETEKRVQNLVKRIREADISVKSKSCEFCKFSAVCRFEPWRLVYSEGSS